MTSSTLKLFVDRIENLDAEQKEIGADKRTVFDEAADAGFDKKAIRRLLRDRREAAKDKGTAELAEQYKILLSEPGATYRSVAEKTGAKKSTLHRLVPKSERGTGHDPDTGEITKTADLRNTPAGDGIEALPPDGQGAVAGNPIEDAAGRSPGDEGEENADNYRDHDYSGRRDALRRHTDGGGNGAGPRSAEVQSDRQSDCRRDQGPVRGNHSADAQPSGRSDGNRPTEAGSIDRYHAVRGAADAGREGELRPGVGDAGRGVDPSSTPHVSVRPDPYEDAPPPFLDQRHKARATG